jgi:CBS domain containing-hemolysin-like protein
VTEWVLLAVAVALIAANAVFVAAEFSLVTVDRATVARRAEAGDRRAVGLARGLRALSTPLSGAQLGITVTSLVVGFLAEPSLARLLRGPLGALGLPDVAVSGVAVTLAIVVATGFQAVFGELVPKNWAISEPLRVGRVVVGPQRAFTWVAGPLIRLLNGSANKLLRTFGIEPREELASARNPRELASLAARSGDLGTLDPRTAQLIERAVEFGDRTAADVMTPRARVRFVPADASAADVLLLAGRTGHARFPVTGDGVDDVLGAVHFKHALAVPGEERVGRQVRDVLREVPVVPGSMPLDVLLTALRSSGGLHLAVVIDEYGGTDGVVTLEDLVEEIVGEIQDEHDRPVARARRLREGSWSLSGLLRPDEASELTGLELPEAREADTLAGLVAERLERLPDVGDAVELEATDTADLDEDGLPRPTRVRLVVTRLDGRRTDRLRLDRLPVAAADQRPASR